MIGAEKLAAVDRTSVAGRIALPNCSCFRR